MSRLTAFIGVPAGYNECEIPFNVRRYEHTAVVRNYQPVRLNSAQIGDRNPIVQGHFSIR
jgi:hypothetical protein